MSALFFRLIKAIITIAAVRTAAAPAGLMPKNRALVSIFPL